MSSDSRKKGLLLIVGLGVLFFVLLGLLLLYWPQSDPSSSGEAVTVYVVPAELEIRTRPEASAPVIETVSQGEALTLVSVLGSWAKIRLESGAEGFAERNMFEEETQRKARSQKNDQIAQLPELRARVTQDVELYAGPGFFYPVTGSLERGDRVVVRTREQDFYAVDLNGAISWAAVEGLEVSVGDAPELTVAAGDDGPDLEEDEPLEDLEDDRRVFEDFADRWEEIAESDRDRSEIDERELRNRLEERRRASGEGPGADGIYPYVPPGGTQPIPVSQPQPNYPRSAQRAGIEGSVIIRAVVRSDGTVERAQILKDLPRGLGESARRAVERWRFRPATYQGEPITVYYTVTVNFSLRG